MKYKGLLACSILLLTGCSSASSVAVDVTQEATVVYEDAYDAIDMSKMEIIEASQERFPDPDDSKACFENATGIIIARILSIDGATVKSLNGDPSFPATYGALEVLECLRGE